MSEIRKSSHARSWLTVHLIFVTKYRYKVLLGEVKERCRDLMRQDCSSLDIRILKGVVSSDQVHTYRMSPKTVSK
ncbi:MAG: transposase [Saprospiraceae bacterium]